MADENTDKKPFRAFETEADLIEFVKQIQERLTADTKADPAPLAKDQLLEGLKELTPEELKEVGLTPSVLVKEQLDEKSAAYKKLLDEQAEAARQKELDVAKQWQGDYEAIRKEQLQNAFLKALKDKGVDEKVLATEDGSPPDFLFSNWLKRFAFDADKKDFILKKGDLPDMSIDATTPITRDNIDKYVDNLKASNDTFKQFFLNPAGSADNQAGENEAGKSASTESGGSEQGAPDSYDFKGNSIIGRVFASA